MEKWVVDDRSITCEGYDQIIFQMPKEVFVEAYRRYIAVDQNRDVIKLKPVERKKK